MVELTIKTLFIKIIDITKSNGHIMLIENKILIKNINFRYSKELKYFN